MTGTRKHEVCHFTYTDYMEAADNIQTWCNRETPSSNLNVVCQSKMEGERKAVE